jgi:ADP-heptose:LPS heptosyltransferase
MARTRARWSVFPQPESPSPRITLLSFRTFGDYVLKAPFLHELYRKYPGAAVTLLTNGKGGEVYPLLDSRLQVVVVDRVDGAAAILRKVFRAPRADVVYAMDDSRTTLLLALLARGKRKTGWVQGISRLYAEGGYFEWKSVRPWISSLMKIVFRPGKIRLPEDKYEGEVELALLDLSPPDAPPSGLPLADYRSLFAWRPAERPPGMLPRTGFIYCAAEAGWVARQLTIEQWTGVISGLLQAFPRHSIVVHGAPAAVERFAGNPRVSPYGQGSVRQLFEKISAADLVIAADSFALHLASLYNIPAIGYFGPAHPHRFRPTGPGSRSLFRQPECSPCLQLRGTARCRKGLIQCASLAALTAADFVAAAERVLADSVEEP